MKIDRPQDGAMNLITVDFDGVLQDERGRPIPNARIRLYHLSIGALAELVTAPGAPTLRQDDWRGDPCGYFQRAQTPVGHYTMEILLNDLTPLSAIEFDLDVFDPFSPSPYEGPEVVRVSLPRGVLQVRPYRPLLGGISGISLFRNTAVSLIRDGECLDHYPEFSGLTTDDDGFLRVPGAPYGTYQIRVLNQKIDCVDAFLISGLFRFHGDEDKIPEIEIVR